MPVASPLHPPVPPPLDHHAVNFRLSPVFKVACLIVYFTFVVINVFFFSRMSSICQYENDEEIIYAPLSL